MKMRLNAYSGKLFMIGSIIISSLLATGCQTTTDDLVGEPIPEVNQDLQLEQPDDRDITEMPGYEKRWQNQYKQDLKYEADFLLASNYIMPADIVYSVEHIQEICEDIITNDKSTERLSLAKEIQSLAEDIKQEANSYAGTIKHPKTGMDVFDLSSHNIKSKLLDIQGKLLDLIDKV